MEEATELHIQEILAKYDRENHGDEGEEKTLAVWIEKRFRKCNKDEKPTSTKDVQKSIAAFLEIEVKHVPQRMTAIGYKAKTVYAAKRNTWAYVSPAGEPMALVELPGLR